MLPVGYLIILSRGTRYYYHYGTYYSFVPEEEAYEVVEPPDDALVPEIPEDAEKVVINGKVYYRYGDTLYKPVFVNGELMYRINAP
jgi:hypothetical protein